MVIVSILKKDAIMSEQDILDTSLDTDIAKLKVSNVSLLMSKK